MKNIILITAAFVLLATLSGVARAQSDDKKPAEKSTTADAWQQALPQAVQGLPVAVNEDAADNVAADKPAQTQEIIVELERKLFAAVKQRDVAALTQLLATDFTSAGINSAESKSDKFNYIDWAQKSFEVKSYDVEKITVRVYGKTAVATIRYKQQANVGSVAANGDFVATDVWIKRANQWQTVSHHVSPVPKS